MIAGCDGHQRRRHVERADAAFDEGARPSPAAGDRRREGIAGDDERGQQRERSEAGNLAPAAVAGGLGSYFDGHFAMTPFGSTEKPPSCSLPLSTTSEAFLNVSGTTPV